MPKIGVVVGTRPEAIKLAPVLLEMKKSSSVQVELVSTGQHKEMLNQVFELFDIRPDHSLDVMTDNQTVNGLLAKVVNGMDDLLQNKSFDGIIVQGDTTTAFGASMAAFNRKVPVFHIEAGLRSYNLQHPFPEEANRKLISVVADINFTPTAVASSALLKEGYRKDSIFEVGNTVIDALYIAKQKVRKSEVKYWNIFKDLSPKRAYVLVTGHRRESFGKGFENICDALCELSDLHPDIDFVYPVHLNPNVREVVYSRLGEKTNIKLIDPVPYDEMIFLLDNCLFVLTDSGGIQEEAPSFNKIVLIMRETTERTEGIENGCAELVGNQKEKIVRKSTEMIKKITKEENRPEIKNPYGDGHSSQRIRKVLENYFLESNFKRSKSQ